MGEDNGSDANRRPRPQQVKAGSEINVYAGRFQTRGLLCVVGFKGGLFGIHTLLGGSRDYGQKPSESERRIMLLQQRMDWERNTCASQNSVLH